MLSVCLMSTGTSFHQLPGLWTSVTSGLDAPARVATSKISLPAGRCRPTLAAQLANTGSAGELITVVAPSSIATTASLTAWRRVGGCWRVVYGPFTAWIGRSGVNPNKYEGDGSTPSGIFNFTSTMYGNAPDPGVRYRYRPLRCGDWGTRIPARGRTTCFVSCGVPRHTHHLIMESLRRCGLKRLRIHILRLSTTTHHGFKEQDLRSSCMPVLTYRPLDA